MDKKAEKLHLLQRLFDDLTLLEIGKAVGDEYAKQFNELGYDEAYNYFERLTLLERLASRLSDQDLISIVEKYREELPPDTAFLGKYYTYIPDKRKLYTKSIWESLRKKIFDLCRQYGEQAKIVIRTLIDMKRDWSFYSDIEYSIFIRALQEKYGLARDDIEMVISVLKDLYIVKLDGDLIKIFPEVREMLHKLKTDLEENCSKENNT